MGVIRGPEEFTTMLGGFFFPHREPSFPCRAVDFARFASAVNTRETNPSVHFDGPARTGR